MSLIRELSTATDDVFGILGQRRPLVSDAVRQSVSEIIEDVRTRGDAALLDQVRKFDSPLIDSIVITTKEIRSTQIKTKYEGAIGLSWMRVKAFHDAQMSVVKQGLDENSRWSLAGTSIGQKIRPLSSAGIYVPGGGANYASSVIMNAVPAQCAGVPTVVITTPAQKNGEVSPFVLAAIETLGIEQAFKIGGASAIAALAFGTELVPKVDKVAGPGNAYVNEAKRQLWGTVGVDGYAGPSEVAVWVDETANPDFAAADFLTQIEHAPDNAGFLVGTDEGVLKSILTAIESQLEHAPRASTMRQAMKDQSMMICCRDYEEAVDVLNAIAPEHLTIAIRDPEKYLDRIYNAGCIMLGDWTPESGGDFLVGPSHTLPTATSARFGSPLSVLDFLKVQSIARLTQGEILGLTDAIEAFGEMEGFPAHGYGAIVRRS